MCSALAMLSKKQLCNFKPGKDFGVSLVVLKQESLDFVALGLQVNSGTWHRCGEGRKDAGDDLIEGSYGTEVSASFKLSGVYIGPLIRLSWIILAGRTFLEFRNLGFGLFCHSTSPH